MHLQSTASIVETTSDTVITAVRSAKQETSSDMQAMYEALTSLMITQHQQSQSQLADIVGYRPSNNGTWANCAQETHQRNLSQTGARLLQRPATLRDLCDTAGYDHSGQLRRPQFGQQVPMSSLCTCDLRQRETRTSTERELFLGVIVYNQRSELFKHSANCVFYKPQKHQDYGARFRVSFHQNLSFLVDLSLSYTSGAGGCSIGPQLRYMQMVQGSPVTDLINSFFETSESNRKSNQIQDWDKFFLLTERKLLKLFQDGKASPCDMSSQGTFLHVGLRLAYKACWLIHLQETVIIGNVWASLGIPLLGMDMMSRFVKTLIRAGVPCGEPGPTGMCQTA